MQLNQSKQLALTVCTITSQYTTCFCKERPKCSVESLTGLISCAGVTRRWFLYTNEKLGYLIYIYGRSAESTWNNFISLLFRTDTSSLLYLFPRITRVGDIEVPQIRPARYIGPEKVIITSIFLRQFLQQFVVGPWAIRWPYFCLPPTQLVEPYSQHKANGYALFLVSSRAFLQLERAVLPNSNCSSPWQAFDDGRLADKDTYFDHLELVEDPLRILLITSKWVTVLFVAPSTSASGTRLGMEMDAVLLLCPFSSISIFEIK